MKLKPYPEYKDSGVPWLGAVPKHWAAAAVKRHYAIQLGKMLQGQSSGPDDREVLYLKAQHVQWFVVRTASAPKMWASSRDVRQFGIAAGDLLVCEGGEGGRCGIVKDIAEPYIIQNALHRIRPIDQCRNDFLQYVMSAVATTGWFDAINNKATIAHFTREKFGALGLPIPSPSEQSAIVRFLDHFDRRINHLILSKRRLIALLNEQKQATIHHAVTRGLDPNVRLKPSGVDWLGEVPEHWEIRRNGQLFVQRNETRYAELPILEVSLKTGVQVRNFKTSDRKQVMSDREKYKRAVKGDIAYNMMRMWQGAVGVAPVDGLVSPAYVVAIPRMGTEPRYFGYLFRIPAYMGEVDRCSRGIVKDRNRLYWEDFKQIPSPCPPTTEQARIADAIVEGTQALENTVEQVQGEISLLREYRTRLIADVVTGKLDVRNVELPELDEVEVLAEQDEETTVEDVNLDSESEEEDLAAEV